MTDTTDRETDSIDTETETTDTETESTDSETGTDGWQLDGDSAAAYERYLVPGMFAPWADELVAAAAVSPGARVLDVGCGTGIVARRAAARAGSDGTVVGLDPNDGMLAVAREAAAEQELSIDWRRGDAADIPFADGAFDAVVCQQVLQFLPDPVSALREMRRVLRPDGRLAVAVWRSIEFHPSYVTVAAALERHVGDEAAAMMRSPFPSWSRSDLHDLVADAGFESAAVTIGIGSMRYPSPAEFVRREAASSPLSGPLGSISAAVRDALVRDVTEGIGDYIDDEGVVFPMETFLVVARPT